MDPVLAACAQLLAVNEVLFDRAVGGLTEGELRRLPVADANPMIWLAGHVSATRTLLTAMLGAGTPVAWAPLFGQKSQPSADAPYPPVAEIQQTLRESGATLRARFAQLTEADLAAPAPRSFPIEDKTVRGAVLFLTYHESYHAGQMAYVRKCLGYPGVVDGQ